MTTAVVVTAGSAADMGCIFAGTMGVTAFNMDKEAGAETLAAARAAALCMCMGIDKPAGRETGTEPGICCMGMW